MIILIRLLDAAALIYVMLIAIRALMSWLRPEVIYAYKKFFDLAARLVDPLLIFVRKVFPAGLGRVDLSPLIAVILVETVKFIIVYFIRLLLHGGAA
jgi:uncharacterized protein YggT (Ycf19 family)